MIIYKLGNKFPKNCGSCPLWNEGGLGTPCFCVAKGDYTAKEIRAEKDGELSMYYHGYLKHRPKKCPLIEVQEVVE